MKKTILNLSIVATLIFCLTGCKEREEIIEYEDVFARTEYYNAIFKTTTYYEDYKIDEKTGSVLGYKEYSLSSSGNKQDQHTYEIAYDESGNKIREVEDKGYYGVVTRTYTYNEDNTIKTSTYKSSKDNVEVLTVYNYEYDDKGRVHKQTEKEDDDVTSYTFEYYENGKIKSKYYQNGDYYMNYEYKYNDVGDVIEETQTSERSVYRIEYEYDENGNEIKEKVYKNGSTLVTYTDTAKYEVVGKKIRK